MSDTFTAYHFVGYMFSSELSFNMPGFLFVKDDLTQNLLIIQKVSQQFGHKDYSDITNMFIKDAWIALCKLSELTTVITFKFGQVSMKLPKPKEVNKHIIELLKIDNIASKHLQEWTVSIDFGYKQTHLSAENYLANLAKKEKTLSDRKSEASDIYHFIRSLSYIYKTGVINHRGSILFFQILIEKEKINELYEDLSSKDLADHFEINLNGPQPIKELLSNNVLS
ncbi:hypothetical protein [Portibacter marinus]|uniref:hypothetical protein n=1 Tax=Portibacter marinus TaxID=2898660 RepID=UPI001F452845|nr:hypothetical protein [Portibacter marinus]